MKDSLCKYCYGCMKLELEDFKEVTSCKGFVCADKEGYEKYIRRENL